MYMKRKQYTRCKVCGMSEIQVSGVLSAAWYGSQGNRYSLVLQVRRL